MTAERMVATVPVAEGLFVLDNGTPSLIGSRCRGCGTVYFPQALSCRNPHCRTKLLERALLPNTGTLFSYTIQRYQPPPLFRMDDWAPYSIGLVDLGDGVQVMGMLTGMAHEDIRIGMALRLVIEPLFTDAVRGSVTTYKFAPDSNGVQAK